MKKNLLLVMFLPMVIYAQKGSIGINTDAPKATLDVHRKELNTLPEGQSQGVIFPHLTTEERNTFSLNTLEKGTMIYNTTKNCIDWWNGSQWACTDGSQSDIPIPPNTNPSTGGAKFKLLGINDAFILSVYDNNYYPFKESDQPTGDGTTASFSPDGTLDPLMDYQGKIGTPGSTNAKKVVFRYECTNGPCTYPGFDVFSSIPTDKMVGETNAQPVRLRLLSGSVPTGTGYVIGYITANKELNIVKLDINKGAGQNKTGVGLATFTNIPDFDGGTLTARLRAVPGILDRYQGKKTNTYAGDTNPVNWAADEYEHEMAYFPITGPDDKTWLNLNLGADYAQINSPFFSPIWQAGALDKSTAAPLTNPTTDQIKQDWRAYGSLFQWQRKADGHELINWTFSNDYEPDSSDSKAKYNRTGSLANSWSSAGTNKFIMMEDESHPSWVAASIYTSSSNKDLWQVDGLTNPCPIGYHVPTHNEYVGLHHAIVGADVPYYPPNNSRAMWNERSLKFTCDGWRNSNGIVPGVVQGIYWISDASEDGVNYDFNFNIYGSQIIPIGKNNNNTGMSVRCIKD